jgi:hypothetical protein
MAKGEVVEFAKAIGAKDLKEKLHSSEYRGFFKRNNYFLIGTEQFFIIKISRSEPPFWGIGKNFIELFNTLTEKSGNYYIVALVSNTSGWVVSKRELLSSIANESLSYSEKGNAYKLNFHNLKDNQSFTSPEWFLKKIGLSDLNHSD